MAKTILNIINLMFRWKRAIFIYMFIIGVSVSALMLMVPKSYKSQAMVHSVSGAENTGLLGMLSGLSGGVSANQNETGFLLSILHSRTLLTDVIKQFDLIKVYDVELFTEALLLLEENYNVDITDEGAIAISFQHKTGWLSTVEEELAVKTTARDVLIFIIKYLDQKNVMLKTQSARYQREFLEGRYDKHLALIDSLEQSSVQYREKMGIISIEQQVEGKMQIVVELKKQLIEIESALFVAKRTLSPHSPEIKMLTAQKDAVILEMENHEKSYLKRGVNGINGLFPSIEVIPEISITIMHQIYEIEANSKLLEYLASQLEEARLREAKDTPTIQVIDAPFIPELRSAPKRGVTVILTSIIAFILIVVSLYFYELVLKHQNSPELKEELLELGKHLNMKSFLDK